MVVRRFTQLINGGAATQQAEVREETDVVRSNATTAHDPKHAKEHMHMLLEHLDDADGLGRGLHFDA